MQIDQNVITILISKASLYQEKLLKFIILCNFRKTTTDVQQCLSTSNR